MANPIVRVLVPKQKELGEYLRMIQINCGGFQSCIGQIQMLADGSEAYDTIIVFKHSKSIDRLKLELNLDPSTAITAYRRTQFGVALNDMFNPNRPIFQSHIENTLHLYAKKVLCLIFGNQHNSTSQPNVLVN
jgi:hypothetical protein